MIDIELGAFLSGPRHSQQDALLRLIGTSIADPQGIDMMQMIDVRLPTTDGREPKAGAECGNAARPVLCGGAQ